MVATSVVFAADDFVVDVFHDGVKIPDARFHLVNEIFGAIVLRVDVELRKGDWLVFNAVNDRYRWGGSYGFTAAALKDGKVPVFETKNGRGIWSACCEPSEAARFIHDGTFMGDRAVEAPTNPWTRCNDEMKSQCQWDGDIVWGPSEARSVWIKCVVP